MYLSEEIQKKWSPVLDHPDLQEISDPYRKSVTAVILENQEKLYKKKNKSFLKQCMPTTCQMRLTLMTPSSSVWFAVRCLT